MQSAERSAGSAWRSLLGLPRDLVDFVYPPTCLLCRGLPAVGPLCAGCESELATLPSAVCSRCRLWVTAQGLCPLGHSDLVVRALGLFDPHYRVLLHALKFHGDLRAGRWLGRRLGAVLHREHLSEQVRAVVPVPLHGVRLRERGFNQSRVLAEEVASALGLPVVESVSRQRNTRSQALLPREERLTNVHGAFTVGSPQENAPVLLVDDVLTTGATLAACAAALGTAGAGAVVAATVALAES